MTAPGWSLDELVDFKQRYGSWTDDRLALYFRRGVEDIRQKAAELALAKNKGGVAGLGLKMPRWTPEDVELLRSLYPTTPTSELAARMGRSARSIHSKAYKLGVEKTRAYKAAMCRINRGLRRPKDPST